MARRRGTTRPKAMARLQQIFIRCHAVRQMDVPQWCQDTCLLHFARVFMLSYWPCQRLNVAAAACSSFTFGTGCSPWSTDWLPPLSLSPCRRCAEPRPADCWNCTHAGGSRRCTVAACSPRRCVCRLGLLVCSSAGGPSCHLPSASVDLSLRRRGWVRSFQRGHGGLTLRSVPWEV